MYGSPSLKQLAPLSLLLFAALAASLLLPDYFIYIANLLMVYLILAIGLDIVMGWAGQFAFAHVAFYGIGVYGTALLHMRLGVPFMIGMPVAALIAAFVGLLIAIPATKLRTVYLALATFAFAESAQWTFRTWDKLTGGPDGLRISSANVLGFSIANDRQAMPVIAILLIAVLAATLFLRRSSLGRSLFAIRDSEHVAIASGIDLKRTKVLALCISALYAGIAGGASTLFQSYVHPDNLGVWTLILLLSMVVVGGSGSVAGVTLGVVLLGLLPELLRAAPKGLLVWQELIYGLILMLSVIFVPKGIWGLLENFRKTRRRSGT